MCTHCDCQQQTQGKLVQDEHSKAASGQAGLTRRQAVAGAAGASAGAVLLSACSSGEGERLTDSDGGPSEPTDMAAVEDVPVGGVIQATNKGVAVMISQPTEGTFHAFSSVCTHQGCQLNAREEKTIYCPCHASVFSVETGAVEGGPAELPLPEFTVEVKDGRIWVS